MSFASDNYSGIHPKALEAIALANSGHAQAYGEDAWTERLQQRLEHLLGAGTRAFPVFNGTGANVVCLQALCRSHQAVICSDFAHIHVDECGAPEKLTGAKLLPVLTGPDGKLTAERIEPLLQAQGVQHHSQPAVISVTQATEWGTVYTPEEVRRLADFAHRHAMKLHMDGARLANAAAFLGCSVAAFTGEAGVDALSFGGTKNGMMLGELVVVWDPDLAREIPFIRKQSMQLSSKMRFVSAQFEAMLEGDLWIQTAAHANRMAQRLAQEAGRVGGVRVVREPQANEVFVRIAANRASRLQKETAFYVWDPRPLPGETEPTVEVRWVCSWDTSEGDIERFVDSLRRSATPVIS